MCSVEEDEILKPVKPAYAVLDLETTGLNRKEDRVIQIGVVKVKNDILTPWMTYVNPLKSRESQMNAFKVHKISPDILSEKPSFAEVAPKLLAFMKDIEYVVAYNALFDWSMLVEEFGRLKTDAEKEEGKKLLEKLQWIDMYRLAIKTFPGVRDLKAGTLFKKFSIHIRTKKTQSFHYQLLSVNLKGEEQKEFTLSETDETNWEDGLHDAVGDALATNSLMNELLKLNGYLNIVDLVNNFPHCRLETGLFLTVDKMLKEGRTSDDDLMAIETEAGQCYSTMSSLRGKTLSESPKRKIKEAYDELYLSEKCRDERIGLIYTAALLRNPLDSPKRQSTNLFPNPPDKSPKKSKAE